MTGSEFYHFFFLKKKEKKAVAVVEAKAAVEEVVEKPNLPFHHIRVHTIAHHVGQRVRFLCLFIHVLL